jgi:hypothetical protein
MRRATRPAPSTPPAPRQLALALDSARLRGMSPPERARALAGLARLLSQAADLSSEERNHDER